MTIRRKPHNASDSVYEKINNQRVRHNSVFYDVHRGLLSEENFYAFN
jgi:hypothetical protein